MKICLPTEDERGLNAPLSDHFGHAPWFLFFDTATGHFDMVANEHGAQTPGHCDPTEYLRSRQARIVVCRALGRRALERLQALGLEVLVTRAETASQAIEAWRDGRLLPMPPPEAFGGGQGHDHGRPRGGVRG